MPAVIEQKIAGILPKYQGELNAYLDYLLFRQAYSNKNNNSALKHEPKTKPAFFSFKNRLTEEGANELLEAQHHFDKIDEDLWR